METSSQELLPGTKKGKPLDIFRFLRKYTVPIIVLGNFIFTLLIPFALMGIKPYYMATAKLQIDPVVQTIIGKGQENSILQQYSDYSRTQATRLRSHDVLEEAVKRLVPEHRDALFFPGAPQERCITMLHKKLSVKIVRRTHLIELELQSGRRTGLAQVLNNVMESYKDIVDSQQKQQNQTRLKYLESERDHLRRSIDNKITTLKDIAKKTHTSEFSEMYNFYYKRAEQLQQAKVKIDLMLMDVETAYNQKVQEKEKISKLDMEPFVEEVVANDWGLDSTQSWTYQQLQELRTKLDGLSEKSSDRTYIEERMKAMSRYEKKMTNEVRKLADMTVYGKRDYELTTNLIKEQSRYDALREAAKDISTQLAKAREEAAINSERLINGEQTQAELRHMRGLLFKYESRINELGVQANAPSRISFALRAQTPMSPAGNNAKKLVMVCVIVPFGFIGFICLVIEFMDNRITNPMNITHALGHPSTWPISRALPHVPFSRVTLEAPASVTSKALRSLALRIYKENQTNESRIFLFNAVTDTSGTSEIILNVGNLLGQIHPNILIIEAVTAKPAMRRLLDIPPSQPGIAEMINGEADFNECIYTDAERNVDILPASGKEKFQNSTLIYGMIITMAKKNYDIVLIDSSPVMQNDFTEYLTVFSDVLLLVVQGNRAMYSDLRRTAELFIRQQIPAIIPVLNWGGPRYVGKLEKRMENSFLHSFLKRIRRAMG
ncbi:Uncharacterized protein involved in exopolysaccharide biosynthesis [Desulfocicer vacuolatum DSM 3385]|uniref:Uncharacterized protein involved in exopolysaccharide biosynthesis n=1 Tax=Desulfocicer vacuolatum DSM 3385 TaxID=1121400 RepID=A0A1W2DPY7_9BACT|nr:hypothetical protein [Desulfocicer vacuolatum]SMC99148.1 Uncharacterized protein involved in exopolysaccharide biosynthesis [Desulfocicer vacuolatum DSM 3385]